MFEGADEEAEADGGWCGSEGANPAASLVLFAKCLEALLDAFGPEFEGFGADRGGEDAGAFCVEVVPDGLFAAGTFAFGREGVEGLTQPFGHGVGGLFLLEVYGTQTAVFAT